MLQIFAALFFFLINFIVLQIQIIPSFKKEKS
jgi:hypothetical protein